MNLLRLAAVALMAAGLTACASTIAPRPELVAAGVSAPVVQGRVTLVMSAEAANQTVSPHPTSFTGGATTLNVPLGAITRAVGEKILGAGFSGGASTAPQAAPGSYGVAVEVREFSYAYDQASNLGLAITPKVSVGLHANVTALDGHKVLDKSYEQKNFTVGKYVASAKPAEKINEGLHLALGQMFRQLLDDLAAASK